MVGIFYAVFNPFISSIVRDKAQSPLVVPAQGIENAGQPFIDALKAQKITLEPFEGATVTDRAGRVYPFESNPNAMFRLRKLTRTSFEEVYRIVV